MKKKRKNRDVMIVCGGHSIMTSNIGIDDTNKFSTIYSESLKSKNIHTEQYGLFGSNLNYHTFYPDVNVKQFNPDEDEFIEPVFRLLSNCIVSKNWVPTEFPEDVLKGSMNLLVGQTVNCDHEDDVGNAIGSVKSVYWQDSYIDEETGITIPGGINGVLKIDGVSNPRIARGINMDPPSIHSNSVTVVFYWEPSHQFNELGEFYEKLGTYDENGQLIRRIVTKIVAYKETSLVSHGADPFAQLIKDNKIINPIYANSVYSSFSEKDDIANHVSLYDFKINQEIDIMHNTSKINNEGPYNFGESKNKVNTNKMNELEKFFEQLFGQNMLSLAEGSKPNSELALSQVKNLISEKQSLSEAIAQANDNITKLNEEIVSLKQTIDSNKVLVNIGEQHLKDVRNHAIESYKKLNGDKVDENIISLLEADTTSIATLISLSSSYESQLEEKFPLHCADCGSNNINRGSSIDKEDNKPSEDKNSESISNSIRNLAKSKSKKVSE